MSKRNYIHIDEVQPLIPLSRRVPFYYIEYSKIKRKNNDIRVLKADLKEEYSVPVCGIGGLFLGPGHEHNIRIYENNIFKRVFDRYHGRKCLSSLFMLYTT